jgi:hypothetical protein
VEMGSAANFGCVRDLVAKHGATNKRMKRRNEPPEEQIEAPRKSETKGAPEYNATAAAMDLHDFVTEFRQKVQGFLWERADKITIGDLVKLTELERETRKQSESKRPREIRIVWLRSEPKPLS